MPIKVVTDRQKKKVDFLTDVDVDYVSLVRHGANQQPFRIIKNDEGGESMQKVTQIVQSILMPEGCDIQQMIGKAGLEYLAEAKTDTVVNAEGYVRYDQTQMDKVDNYKLLKVDSGWLVVGNLKEGESADGLLTLTQEQLDKLAGIPDPPAMMGRQQNYGPSFMEHVDREIFAMLDIVGGTLRQANMKASVRKKTVLGALDAFRSFMSIALDAIGNETAVDTAKLDTLINAVKGETGQGGDTMPDLFKDKEEFNKSVQEMISAQLDSFLDKLKETFAPKVIEPQATEPAAKADDAATGMFQSLIDQVKAMGEELKAVQTKMDAQLETTPAGAQEDLIDQKVENEDKKSNPFAGLLTKKAA